MLRLIFQLILELISLTSEFVWYPNLCTSNSLLLSTKVEETSVNLFHSKILLKYFFRIHFVFVGVFFVVVSFAHRVWDFFFLGCVNLKKL